MAQSKGGVSDGRRDTAWADAAHANQQPPAGFLGRCLEVVSGSLRRTRETWPGLAAYERFEQVASLVVTALVSLLIVAALIHLSVRVVLLVLYGLADPAEQQVFQTVFGMVMTVLIALEFPGVLARKRGIIEVRTVVLIALLALVRKFIIIDAAHAEPLTEVGLAAAVLALGAVYWPVRDQDRRDAPGEI